MQMGEVHAKSQRREATIFRLSNKILGEVRTKTQKGKLEPIVHYPFVSSRLRVSYLCLCGF
jgi:hypothetical protein